MDKNQRSASYADQPIHSSATGECATDPICQTTGPARMGTKARVDGDASGLVI